MTRKLTLAVVGPTASGKTALAVRIAQTLNGEIVCMDSTTVYRGFDIGSSKPSEDERKTVPHHLLDILRPDDAFSAGHFVQQADETIEKIQAKGKLPIVVGGTYFYLRALQHGMYPTAVIPAEAIEAVEAEFFQEEAPESEAPARLHAELSKKDPAAAKAIHPNDRYRLVRALAILRTTGEKPSALKPAHQSEAQKNRLWMKYAIAISRHTLSANIVRRTDKMIAGGLLDETKRIREKHPKARALASVGYAETCRFLDKQLTQAQLRNEIIEKTRQLAKRQITWLRSDSEIRYIDDRDLERVELEVSNLRFALGDK